MENIPLFFSSITEETEKQSLNDCFYDSFFLNENQKIRVIIAPFWLEDYSYHELSIYSWAYHVRIENHNDVPIYFLNQNWNIIKGNGLQEKVTTKNTFKAPMTLQAKTICQFSASISTNTPSNFIQGQYLVATDKLDPFDLHIPSFNLDIPDSFPSFH